MREDPIGKIQSSSDLPVSYDIPYLRDIQNDNSIYKHCIKINIDLSNENDNADIYLPDDEDRYYLIVLLQGADLPKAYYKRISELICRWGFIVTVVDHYRESLSGRHLYAEQEATNYFFYRIKEYSENKNSFLYNRLHDEKFIILGHSYGAGCGLFMINNECKWPFCSSDYKRPTELSGGVFYGVSLKHPWGEGYYKIDNETIPVLLIAGESDGAIRYEYAEMTLESIMSPPGIFIKLKGANHYAINDINPPPGADADKNIQILNQEIGLDIISTMSVIFINEFILHKEDYTDLFNKKASDFKEFIEIKKNF